MKKICDIILDFTTSFDGECVSYGLNDSRMADLIKKIHNGAHRDAVNFSRDMYLAMRHEDEQKETASF